jgi:hypothetical protein
VHPGQTVTVRFSGGYLAINYEMVCGAATQYIFGDELSTPEFSHHRFDVLLDDSLLAEARCQKKEDCQVEFAIPPDISPGKHQLTLAGFVGEQKFDIEVVD